MLKEMDFPPSLTDPMPEGDNGHGIDGEYQKFSHAGTIGTGNYENKELPFQRRRGENGNTPDPYCHDVVPGRELSKRRDESNRYTR